MQSKKMQARRNIEKKLLFIGTEKAHERYLFLVHNSVCPRCGYFLHTWGGVYGFGPEDKPKDCYRCKTPNPLKDVVDPLDQMVAEKEKKVGRRFYE